MKRNYINVHSFLVMACFTILAISCKKEKYALPTAKQSFQNDVIKRTLGPNVAGLNIEFAYAMALPPEKGKLVSSQVVASISGAAGTFLEHRSYYTLGTGKDTGIVIGSPSVTKDSITTVDFTKDTSAVTLRYYYIIPQKARGESVSFTFSGKSSTGETVSYKMGPYTISKMDIVRNLTVTNGNAAYISISDMAVYNTATVAANASKIDLIYLYRTFPGSTFNHALVSPAADTQYLPSVVLPVGVNKSTKMRKVFNLQDFHLAQLQFGIYIDDLDFQQLNFTDAPNYAINLRAEAGTWVETADGKYRAYIYINSVNNTARSAVISIKRYALN